MIKMMGAVLLVVSTTGIGLWKANFYAARSKELEDLISALQLLETEISYSVAPLPDALQRIGFRIAGRVGLFLQNAGTELLRGDGRSAGEIFTEQLERSRTMIHLREQDLEILRTFGHTLGNSDRSDQLKHIRLAHSRLAAEAQNARDEKERLGKMWRYLGALTGLAGVIIMY